MKTKLMALALMAGSALFASPRVAFGVQVGGPAPVVVPGPAAVSVYQPPSPGPGYVWIDGYYDAYGNWCAGYWTLPPYAGSYWIAPRFTGGHFYAGYWGGPRGVYHTEPHVAPRAFDRGHEHALSRPMVGRERGNFRQGFRR